MKLICESIGNDTRYAWRSMKRTPGFTFIAVLILTLGIGATTAIFAVVQAVLLRPLPYADSEHLVAFSRAAFAGAAGLLVARLGLAALVRLSPFHLPVSGTVRIDPYVLAFAFAMCAAATIAAGLFPALHAGRQREDLLGGAGTRASGGQTVVKVQRALTVAQVALGLALLTSAGLLVHSLWRLSAVEPGFRRDGVVGFSVSVPSDHPRPQNVQLYARMLEAVRTIPGVASAGWITLLPPESRKGVFIPFSIEGRPAPQTPADRLFCNLQVTSEDYFETVGIPLLRGRAFMLADAAGEPAVTIVNETLARRDFPNGDAIGQRIVTMFDPRPREIVGIIRTIHDRGLATATVATVYVPFRQFSLPYGSIAMRASISPDTLVPEVRRRLAAIDPTIPLTEFQTLDARLYKSLDEPRFYTLMAAACALTAPLLRHPWALRSGRAFGRPPDPRDWNPDRARRAGWHDSPDDPSTRGRARRDWRRNRRALVPGHDQGVFQPVVRREAERSGNGRGGSGDHRRGDAPRELRTGPPREQAQSDGGAPGRLKTGRFATESQGRSTQRPAEPASGWR
jgi:hypothetical protein